MLKENPKKHVKRTRKFPMKILLHYPLNILPYNSVILKFFPWYFLPKWSLLVLSVQRVTKKMLNYLQRIIFHRTWGCTLAGERCPPVAFFCLWWGGGAGGGHQILNLTISLGSYLLIVKIICNVSLINCCFLNSNLDCLPFQTLRQRGLRM